MSLASPQELSARASDGSCDPTKDTSTYKDYSRSSTGQNYCSYEEGNFTTMARGTGRDIKPKYLTFIFILLSATILLLRFIKVDVRDVLMSG